MDTRCGSPFDVSAALEILGRLSISEGPDWSLCDFPAKDADQMMPYAFEEEGANACDPSLYDPALFTSTLSHPASPLLTVGDKPLPPSPPNLILANSTSTPQLQELAELAHIPATPILSHQPLLAYLATSLASPRESPVDPFPAATLMPPASGWSIDSRDPASTEHPVLSRPAPDSVQASPTKTRKRDHLMRFISRARAGSVTKQSTSPSPMREELDIPTSHGSHFPIPSRISTAMRHEHMSPSVCTPQQMAATKSIILKASALGTSLVTPGASLPDLSTVDVFGTALPAFTPVLSTPEMSDNTHVDMDKLPSLRPTLPPPKPGSSTPSFFLPQKQEGPFTLLTRKMVRRRRKKLIVCWMDTQFRASTGDVGNLQVAADTHHKRRQQQREEALLAWCKLHGAKWEVADMVCCIEAPVYIKNVGRVLLMWQYLN
ncbi:hypothetical protein BC629DRAFT_1596716 [Irpex lacteus]|nr:hypothetical protein BC629DRAFT_1596716 [Irpex lacteus]